MLNLILDKANIRLRTQKKVVIGSTVLAFEPKKYEEILNFLRICLMHSAGVGLPERDELNYPQSSAPIVSRYLETLNGDPRNVVLKFADFVENFLTASSGLAQTQCMLHLVRKDKSAFYFKINSSSLNNIILNLFLVLLV